MGSVSDLRGLDFKIAVCSSLWKLLLASAEATGSSRPLYGYANRTKILDNLRAWLCHLDVDHIQPFWREAITQDERDAAEPIAKLFTSLDVRLVLRLLIEEVRRSPRTDCSINNSKRRKLDFAKSSQENLLIWQSVGQS